ncbi:MAG: prenyltransferase/squalene oxidase repeat-containing protein [Candidatus Hydrogenedentes bacterium]|nr:prenyltransferase/squalene oxidase repeat-containing protein [Candidatus Hydrogenedentota bacterium]
MLFLTILAGFAVQASLSSAPLVESSRPAIEKGILFVQNEGLRWKKEYDCASCHHVPMAIWTLNEAKSFGFTINEVALTEMTHWVLTEDDQGKIIPADGRNQVTLAAAYTTLGVTAGNANPALKAMTDHLVSQQGEDGSWTCLPEGIKPILADSVAGSLLTQIALRSAAFPELEPAIAKADAWLSAQPVPDDAQRRALILLLAARKGAEPAALVPLMDAIVDHQNPDGGWSQAPEMPSDAYATGQALYALASARCGNRHPASARAIAFLLQTQREDGSWPMTSRPNETNGKPAINLTPITCAGSAWAVLGMLRGTSIP